MLRDQVWCNKARMLDAMSRAQEVVGPSYALFPCMAIDVQSLGNSRVTCSSHRRSSTRFRAAGFLRRLAADRVRVMRAVRREPLHGAAGDQATGAARPRGPAARHRHPREGDAERDRVPSGDGAAERPASLYGRHESGDCLDANRSRSTTRNCSSGSTRSRAKRGCWPRGFAEHLAASSRSATPRCTSIPPFRSLTGLKRQVSRADLHADRKTVRRADHRSAAGNPRDRDAGEIAQRLNAKARSPALWLCRRYLNRRGQLVELHDQSFIRQIAIAIPKRFNLTGTRTRQHLAACF